MKSRSLILVLAVYFVLMFTQASSAASVSYSVDSMSGSWAWGNTQWNAEASLGYVDNAVDLGVVNDILTGPYIYQSAGSDTANGIYNYDPLSPNDALAGVTFSIDAVGGATVDSINILSSRSYSASTIVKLLFSNNGGTTWNTFLSTTTGALGWNDVGTGGTETEMINLAIGGVSADMFQLVFDGSQISLHSIAVKGTPSSVPTVPEPSTFLLLGAGLAGILIARRKTALNR